MTLDLGMLTLISSPNKASYVIFVNQVWFQLDFNFSINTNFRFSANLIVWPQMTFDFINNEGSHVTPVTQVWLKSIHALWLNFLFSDWFFSKYVVCTPTLHKVPLVRNRTRDHHIDRSIFHWVKLLILLIFSGIFKLSHFIIFFTNMCEWFCFSVYEFRSIHV